MLVGRACASIPSTARSCEPMDQLEVEGLIKDLNTRTKRIEQILPTLATKEDLKAFATKDDLKAYPTRDEVKAMINEEGKQTRRHFDVVAEGLKDSIKVIADGHKALADHIDSVGRDIRSVLDNHERRITKLEAKPSRRQERSGRN